jgi:hypothetical protein
MINEKLILDTLRNLTDLSVSQTKTTAAFAAVLGAKLPALNADERNMFFTNSDSLVKLADLQEAKLAELDTALATLAKSRKELEGRRTGV